MATNTDTRADDHDQPSQTSVIDKLIDEQRRLTLSSFDSQDAWSLGERLVRSAGELDLSVSINVRTPVQVLFHHARPGTTADNDRWIRRKSRTAFHFQESSWLVRQRFAARGADFERDSGLNPHHYAAHGGAVPIAVVGAGVVAVLTVSGLPQREDHEFAVRGLDELAGR